jgi:hypothetical protein
VGTITFGRSVAASTRAEVVISTQGTRDVMWLYWPEWGLAAPWYRTFDEALNANPFPRPFNGTDWPAMDWYVAP